jgi:hypothetical protein
MLLEVFPQRKGTSVAFGGTPAESDRKETDVRCARSGTDSIDRQRVLRGPLFGNVPIVVQRDLSFATTLVAQSQLYRVFQKEIYNFESLYTCQDIW